MDEQDERERVPGPVAVRWRVSGRVQGVGFRYYVLLAARGLGLAGDVANLADGRVEVRVRGPRDRVDRLREKVQSGPPGARVDGLEAAPLEAGVVLGEFTIR